MTGIGRDLAVYMTYFAQGGVLTRRHAPIWGQPEPQKERTRRRTKTPGQSSSNVWHKALGHGWDGRRATNEGEGDKIQERNSNARQGRQAPSQWKQPRGHTRKQDWGGPPVLGQGLSRRLLHRVAEATNPISAPLRLDGSRGVCKEGSLLMCGLEDTSDGRGRTPHPPGAEGSCPPCHLGNYPRHHRSLEQLWPLPGQLWGEQPQPRSGLHLPHPLLHAAQGAARWAVSPYALETRIASVFLNQLPWLVRH